MRLTIRRQVNAEATGGYQFGDLIGKSPRAEAEAASELVDVLRSYIR